MRESYIYKSEGAKMITMFNLRNEAGYLGKAIVVLRAVPRRVQRSPVEEPGAPIKWK